jgi:hypothetical protein
MPLTQTIGGAGGTSTSTQTTRQNPLQTAAGIGMMGLSAMSGMGGLSGLMGGMGNMSGMGAAPWNFNGYSGHGNSMGFASPAQRR